MRASMHLVHLHDATQARIKRLSDIYANVIQANVPQQNYQLGYLAIELDNLVISVLREFTMSTIRQARTRLGVRIKVNNPIGPEGEIAAYVLSILNPVRFQKLAQPVAIGVDDEPTVRDPKEIEKVLLHAGATNIQSLQNALALNSGLFKNLKSLRHFYAHRGKDTFRKASLNAANMGILNINHPDDVLMHVVAGKPYTVLEDWFVDAALFFEFLME